MKAFMRERYGSPDTLELREIARPTPGAGEVLVKIHAVSLNASDWEILRGKPLYARLFGVFRPRIKILGSDIAGKVVARGPKADKFKIGDSVFGDVIGKFGGIAGYVAVPQSKLLSKPDGLTFQEASALPQSGCIALQGIFDFLESRTDAKVLINGAGGGSGAFAIQMAKYRGAEVTAVDIAEKLDAMKALGADHVVDYKWEDFTKINEEYDLILDLAAYKSVFAYPRALKPGGQYLMVGGSTLLMLQVVMLGKLLSLFTGKQIGILPVKPNQGLDVIVKMIEYGRLKPVIDRTFNFDETVNALTYLGEGHAKGKVVIDVISSD